MGDVPAPAELVPWLRLQLDEQAGRARSLLAGAQHTSLALREPRLLGREIPGWGYWPDVERVCRELLAEVDVKRRVLDVELDRVMVEGPLPGRMRDLVETDVIRWLAQPYADRPGWREQWREELEVDDGRTV